MPIPNKKLDKEQEAINVSVHLNKIEQAASRAKSLANLDILALYFQAIRTGIKLKALTDYGFTAEVLGPIYAANRDIVWQEHELEFLALKNTHLPAFMTAIAINEAELCKQELNGDSLKPIEISQATKDVLLPLINNISNVFE